MAKIMPLPNFTLSALANAGFGLSISSGYVSMSIVVHLRTSGAVSYRNGHSTMRAIVSMAYGMC